MPANQRITNFQDSAESVYEAAGNRVSEAYDGAENYARQNPGTSLLVTFGIGFGIGLALTAMLQPTPRRKTWSERNIPDWLSSERLSEMVSHLPEKIASRRTSAWW